MSLTRLKAVVQEEETGCGIAAVATIARQSYANTKLKANALGIFADDEKLFSETSHVRKLLGNYGIQVSDKEVTFNSWQELPELALLAIKYHEIEGRPFWHWVVFSRQGGNPVVLDSAAYLNNNVRTDFKAMTPEWFIEILNL
jgi:ABC-type bacteriocin/lantibiotic exporter with double-glycine peptidase domain